MTSSKKSPTATQRRSKVLTWIETELSKGEAPAAPGVALPWSADSWSYQFDLYVGQVKVDVAGCSEAEKRFVLKGVKACGFTPTWKE